MAIFVHYPFEISLSVIAGAALFFTSDTWERIMFRRWMKREKLKHEHSPRIVNSRSALCP